MRFLLFRGEDYYPMGGWGDFKGRFDTLEAAIAACGEMTHFEWAHIVDLESAEEVWSRG